MANESTAGTSRGVPDPASLTAAFADAMASAGVPPPADIIGDGRLHRFYVEGDRRGSRNGWYVLYLDGMPAAVFGSWKRQLYETWTAKRETEFDAAEHAAWLKRVQAARQAAEDELHQAAAKRAAQLWDEASPADPAHPYLVRKHILPHGARQLGERLVVPVMRGDTFAGLQFIAPDGKKRFAAGTAKCGASWTLGELNGSAFIAEGFATAATISEATGQTAVVAFDAGNLKPATTALLKRYPGLTVVVAADNDEAGIKGAHEAAAAVGARVVCPETPGDDFNDVAVKEGLAAVAAAITQQLNEESRNEDTRPLFDPLAIRFSRFLDTEPPERKWLLPDLLPLDVVGLLASGGGTGKSFLLFQLCIALSSGVPFIGMAPDRVGSTLYVAAEDDEGELHRRGRRILDHLHEEDVYVDRAALGERFHVLSRVGASNLLTTRTPTGEVQRTELLAQLIEAAQQIPDLLLIALDPISRFRGGQANAEEDVTRLIEALEALREVTHATVLISSHVNKASLRDTAEADQSAVRGSSALVDGARWVGTLQALRRDAAEDYGVDPDDARRFLRFEVPKNNYAAPFAGSWLYRDAGGILVPTTLQQQPPQQRRTRRNAQIQQQHDDVVNRLVALLQEKGPLTRNQIERRFAGVHGVLGIGSHALRGIIDTAIAVGDLLLEEPAGRGGGQMIRVPETTS
jgi:putative DNA primase/helicase